jgi:hypothetical protein
MSDDWKDVKALQEKADQAARERQANMQRQVDEGERRRQELIADILGKERQLVTDGIAPWEVPLPTNSPGINVPILMWIDQRLMVRAQNKQVPLAEVGTAVLEVVVGNWGRIKAQVAQHFADLAR